MNTKHLKNTSKLALDTVKPKNLDRGVDEMVEHCVPSEIDGLIISANVKSKVFDSAKSKKEEFQFAVEGVTGLSGERWIKVTHEYDHAWAKRTDFRAQGILAEERLAQGNIVMIGSGMKSRLLKMVAAVNDFPERPLIERPGWNRRQFALADGTVIAPHGDTPGEVVFRVAELKCLQAGSIGAWKREVAEPLAGMDIASFLMMCAFASPLLELTDRQDNFGLEIVGPGGTGKSTIQQLISSALGAPGYPHPYAITLDTTLAGLEEHMPFHADQLMVLDEANLYAAAGAESAQPKRMRDLVFKLAIGSVKARYKAISANSNSRFIFIVSSNESFTQVTAGARGEGYRAAADRMRALRIMPGDSRGLFQPLPADVLSSGDMAATLMAAATRNHGKAIRRFLHHLVNERAGDERRLRARIARHMAEFRRAAGVDENNGSAKRIADAFGLVAAAGRAAVHFGALPESYRCMDAALACYHHNRTNP